MKKYYTDITKDTKTDYVITLPGAHVYFLHNRSAEIIFTIEHKNAHLYVFGLYEGSEKDRLSLKTTQQHNVPGARSTIMIKGVFRDRARFDFSGLISLAPCAQKTEAFLENRNLLLSDTAHVTTKPALEIYPDDVICTHAATVAQIDPEHIHLLMTRGLSHTDAHSMLVEGFVEDLYHKRDDVR